MRAYCSSCQYPQKMCLCAYFTRIENRTPILILQHPKERNHPLNTIRIAKHCLQTIEVRHTPIEDSMCQQWTKDAALLFPHHQSIPLPLPSQRTSSIFGRNMAQGTRYEIIHSIIAYENLLPYSQSSQRRIYDSQSNTPQRAFFHRSNCSCS